MYNLKSTVNFLLEVLMVQVLHW